jgi:hypothetical protein
LQISNRKSQIERRRSKIETRKAKIESRKSTIDNRQSSIDNHPITRLPASPLGDPPALPGDIYCCVQGRQPGTGVNTSPYRLSTALRENVNQFINCANRDSGLETRGWGASSKPRVIPLRAAILCGFSSLEVNQGVVIIMIKSCIEGQSAPTSALRGCAMDLVRHPNFSLADSPFIRLEYGGCQ